MQTGKITQIMGQVVDVEFEPGKMPAIFNALKVTRADGDDLLMEVMQHIGGSQVRTIVLGPHNLFMLQKVLQELKESMFLLKIQLKVLKSLLMVNMIMFLNRLSICKVPLRMYQNVQAN